MEEQVIWPSGLRQRATCCARLRSCSPWWRFSSTESKASASSTAVRSQPGHWRCGSHQRGWACSFYIACIPAASAAPSCGGPVAKHWCAAGQLSTAAPTSRGIKTGVAKGGIWRSLGQDASARGQLCRVFTAVVAPAFADKSLIQATASCASWNRRGHSRRRGGVRL